jgi:hypothetical protein
VRFVGLSQVREFLSFKLSVVELFARVLCLAKLRPTHPDIYASEEGAEERHQQYGENARHRWPRLSYSVQFNRTRTNRTHYNTDSLIAFSHCGF